MMKKINQNKVNMMVLDMLEDIIGKSTVYDGELGRKAMTLNTYLYVEKTTPQHQAVKLEERK